MHATRAAFTFIEMMVVMALIGVMAAFVLPRFVHRTPTAEWPVIIDELNNLVTFARHEAIANHKIYRLTFTKDQQQKITIDVQEENPDPEHPNKKVYPPATSDYFNPHYTFHESVLLKTLYNGKQKTLVEDEKGIAYCYIIPDGLTQDITLHLFHKSNPVEKNQSEEKGVTIKLHPFAGVFTIEEGFIKP